MTPPPSSRAANLRLLAALVALAAGIAAWTIVIVLLNDIV
jgi:hypothetical protein